MCFRASVYSGAARCAIYREHLEVGACFGRCAGGGARFFGERLKAHRLARRRFPPGLARRAQRRASSVQRLVRRYWEVTARRLATKETVRIGIKRGIHGVTRLGEEGGASWLAGTSRSKSGAGMRLGLAAGRVKEGVRLKNGGGGCGRRRPGNGIETFGYGWLVRLGAVLAQSLALGIQIGCFQGTRFIFAERRKLSGCGGAARRVPNRGTNER